MCNHIKLSQVVSSCFFVLLSSHIGCRGYTMRLARGKLTLRATLLSTFHVLCNKVWEALVSSVGRTHEHMRQTHAAFVDHASVCTHGALLYNRYTQRRERCASFPSKPAYIAVGCDAFWVCLARPRPTAYCTHARMRERSTNSLLTAGLNTGCQPSLVISRRPRPLPLPFPPPSPRCLVLSLASSTEI